MYQIEDRALYLINNHRGRCPSSMRDFVGLSGKGRCRLFPTLSQRQNSGCHNTLIQLRKKVLNIAQ